MSRCTPILVFLAIGLVLAVAVPSCVKGAAVASNPVNNGLHEAQSTANLRLQEGEWGIVPAGQMTNVTVDANGTRVDSMSEVSFTFNYTEDVNLSILFNNYTFNAPTIPEQTNYTQVFYFKILANTTAPFLAGVVITLRYNTSALLFTDRALWVFYYDNAVNSPWNRIDNTQVDLDTGVVNFTMPSLALSNVEFSLSGQITRFGEFPLWGWILLIGSIGIIVFMTGGEILYHGIVNVKLKGTDGRVTVRIKRFFAAWSRVFTQLSDRVGGMIEDYFAIPHEAPVLPPQKAPFIVSAQGPFNRLEKSEDDLSKPEDFEAIAKLPRPEVMAQSLERNPISSAVFIEHQEYNIQHAAEDQSVTYIPKAAQKAADQSAGEQESQVEQQTPETGLETTPAESEQQEFKLKKAPAKKKAKKTAKKAVKKAGKKAGKKAAKKRAKKPHK
jgi:hypothetical protein